MAFSMRAHHLYVAPSDARWMRVLVTRNRERVVREFAALGVAAPTTEDGWLAIQEAMLDFDANYQVRLPDRAG